MIGRASQSVFAGGKHPFEGLEHLGYAVTLQRDEELYRAGHVADRCWRVITGCVRKVEVLDDGRRHVSAFLLPRDIFGFDDPATYALGAEAVTQTTLTCYPRPAVEALAESNTAVSQYLGTLTMTNLHIAYQRMMLLGRRTSAERLASFILEMARRLGSADATLVGLPMGREDVADYLGLTKETVCRVLTEMARSSVVRLTRSAVEILDPAELVSRAAGPRTEKGKQIASRVWRPCEARSSIAAL